MDRGARRWILYGFLSTFGKFRFALRAAASRPDGAEGAVGAVGCKSSDVTLLAGRLVIFILTVRVVFLTKRHGFGPVPAGVGAGLDRVRLPALLVGTRPVAGLGAR